MTESRTSRLPRSPDNPWPEVVLAISLIVGLIAVLALEMKSADTPQRIEGIEGLGKEVAVWVAFTIEILAAAVIGLGTLRSVWEFMRAFVHDGVADALGDIRLRLGRVLTLGLELTLAADILQTAFAPTRREILTLAAVVLLRTLLNLFLEREIRAAETMPEVEDAAE